MFFTSLSFVNLKTSCAIFLWFWKFSVDRKVERTVCLCHVFDYKLVKYRSLFVQIKFHISKSPLSNFVISFMYLNDHTRQYFLVFSCKYEWFVFSLSRFSQMSTPGVRILRLLNMQTASSWLVSFANYCLILDADWFISYERVSSVSCRMKTCMYFRTDKS